MTTAAYVAQLVRRQRAEIKRQLLALHRRGVRVRLYRGRDSIIGRYWSAGVRERDLYVVRKEQRDALAQLLTILAAESVASTVPPPAEASP